MSTQYYFQPAAEQLPAPEIERRLGVNPDTYGSTGLEAHGVYLVTGTENPYDENLYTVVLSYTIDGANAVKTWTPTPLPLDTAKTNGTKQVIKAADAYFTAYQSDGDLNSAVLFSIAPQLDTNKLAVLTAKGNILQDQITAIAAATTVDEVNAIVNPPLALTATLKLTRSSNNLTSGKLPALTGASKTDLTLVTTNSTIAGVDATISFPSKSGAWDGSPYTWTLKYGIYTLGTGVAGSGTADYTIDWTAPITPLAINS